MSEKFSLKARLKSFRYALQGIPRLLREQHNARIHFLATLIVIAAGCYFPISAQDWGLLLLAIGAVWMAEAMNTAVEYLGDAVSREQHPLIGAAKDVAAAGVLFMALAAAAVGGIVFLPHLLG